MPLTSFTHSLFVGRAEAAANSTFSDTLTTNGDFANKPTATIDVLDPTFLDPTTAITKAVDSEQYLMRMVLSFHLLAVMPTTILLRGMCLGGRTRMGQRS